MKRLALVAALLLSSGASAQAPREVSANDTRRLDVGQSIVLEFDRPVKEFAVMADGVVKVIPRTDQSFSVQAVTPGSVMAIISDEKGKVIHRMNFVVGGQMVKIYGVKSAKSGYLGVMCSSTGCDRPDPDVEPIPFSTTRSETRNTENGSVTISREYR